MKILLYDTGDVREELNEPIGIELLAAHILHEFGDDITVDIKWFNAESKEILFNPLQYDIIGISIHINGLSVFENIYRQCNEINFKGLIVVGNSIATFAYEQLLSNYPNIICSIGEGEYTFKEIVKGYMSNHLNPFSIPNLAFLDKNNLTVTERATFDIENYLPPFRAFNNYIKANRGIARIEASRGCSWNKCSFCGAAHKYNNTGWRPINIKIIIEQLIELSRAGLKTVYFCDEDFIGNDIDRFSELVNTIHEKMSSKEISPEMKFFISIKPIDFISSSVLNTIKLFMECGLKELFVGLESGCESQLKRYNKCTNVKVNLTVINKINVLIKIGLTVDIGFIFFDYHMTSADVEDNIKFIETNQLYKLASSLFKPMRVQPFTKINTQDIHKSEFLIDDLMYSYHFSDNTVEKIYNTFSHLKLEDIAHKIQSIYRRELSSELERDLAANKLAELRFLQYSAIKTIANCYIQNEIDEFQLKHKLNEILSNAENLV